MYSYNLGTFFIIDEDAFKSLIEVYVNKKAFPSTRVINRLASAGAFENIDYSFDGKHNDKNILNSFLNCNFIVFETSNNCQLACDYCSYGKLYDSLETFRDDELSIDTAKNLIGYLYENGTAGWKDNSSKLTLGFYGGEPLLRPDFILSIIEHCNSLNVFPQYAITTNGILLKKNIDLLVKNNFQILVSLDGPKDGNTARRMINGKPSFGQVVDSLLFLKQTYPDFYKTNVAVNAVLTSYTDLDREIKFFKNDLGLSNWNFNAISEFGTKEELLAEFNKLNYSAQLPENETAINNAASNLCWNAPIDYNLLFQDGFRFPNTIPTNTCLPFGKKAFLSSKGYLFACEKIAMNMPLGIVTEESLQIFSSEVASQYNDIFNKYREYCVRCQKFPVCTKCALQSDDKDLCPEFLEKYNLQEWFSDRISKLKNRKTVLNHILDNARYV